MTDLIKGALNWLEQQRRGYSLLPNDDRDAAAAAISAKPIDNRSPPSATDLEEKGPPPRRGERSTKLFWLAGFLASIISPLQAQERKEVAITPLLSSTITSSGQPIALPQKDAEVVVAIYDIVPGVVLPVHKHPYPMYAYVLSGNLRVTNMETGRSNTYKAGDFILESVGQFHTGANIGGDPLKLLVINIVEKGQSNTVLQRQSLPLPEPRKEGPPAPPGRPQQFGVQSQPSIGEAPDSRASKAHEGSSAMEEQNQLIRLPHVRR